MSFSTDDASNISSPRHAAAPVGGGRSADAAQPSYFNIAEYFRLALKHKIVIALTFVSCLIIGILYTLLTTPMYTAAATLQIDREPARVVNVDDTSPREQMGQSEEFFQTQYGLLNSRSLAERVMEAQNLAASDAFLETMGVSPPRRGSAAELATRRRDLVLEAIEDNLDVSPLRGSRLVVISFQSPDAALSARIVNTFTEQFIQSNLDRRFESSLYARKFLEDLIAQTRVRLEAAERQLVQYATQQQIINLSDDASPDQTQSLAQTNLGALNQALAEAQAARIEVEAKWNEFAASLFGEPVRSDWQSGCSGAHPGARHRDRSLSSRARHLQA